MKNLLTPLNRYFFSSLIINASILVFASSLGVWEKSPIITQDVIQIYDIPKEKVVVPPSNKKLPPKKVKPKQIKKKKIPKEKPIERPEIPAKKVEVEDIKKEKPAPVETPPKLQANLPRVIMTSRAMSVECRKKIRKGYDRFVRHRNYEGKVVLNIEILKSGKAGEVSIRQTSGYPKLDKFAINIIKKCKSIPRKRNNRVSFSGLAIAPIQFGIEK